MHRPGLSVDGASRHFAAKGRYNGAARDVCQAPLARNLQEVESCRRRALQQGSVLRNDRPLARCNKAGSSERSSSCTLQHAERFGKLDVLQRARARSFGMNEDSPLAQGVVIPNDGPCARCTASGIRNDRPRARCKWSGIRNDRPCAHCIKVDSSEDAAICTLQKVGYSEYRDVCAVLQDPSFGRIDLRATCTTSILPTSAPSAQRS